MTQVYKAKQVLG